MQLWTVKDFRLLNSFGVGLINGQEKRLGNGCQSGCARKKLLLGTDSVAENARKRGRNTTDDIKERNGIVSIAGTLSRFSRMMIHLVIFHIVTIAQYRINMLNHTSKPDNLSAGLHLVFLCSLLPLLPYLLCLFSEARVVLLLDGNHTAVDSPQPL